MNTSEQKTDTYKGPFWRSNGAICIVIKSLAEAEQVLNKMLREQRIVDSKLVAFYTKYPFDERQLVGRRRPKR
jgi:hypothetical protein